MTDLPQGWAEVTVKDVATIQLGRQRSPKDHTGPHMRPYLRAANVGWGGLRLDDVKEMNFDPDEAATFELEAGDILLNEASGSPNEVGKPVIYGGEVPGACFQNTLLRVKSDGPLRSYLYWYFMHAAMTGAFGEAGRGVNIRHLGKKGLADFALPLPPFAEQQRIVNAIEEHVTRIDAASRYGSGARQRVAQLRVALLDQATEGDWPKQPLGELLTYLRNGYFVSRPTVDPPGVPIFRISAVRPMHLVEDDVRYADVDAEECKGFFVEQGDLLFTRYSGSSEFVGACAVVPSMAERVLHPDKLIRAVPDPTVADPSYLCAYLTAPRGRREVTSRVKTTAGQIGIAGGQLKQVPVALPPLDVQRRIVRSLNQRLDGLHRLDAACSAADTKAQVLRQALLTEAFAGRLVPQLSDDEPARMLLDRIAGERATSKSVTERANSRRMAS